MHCPSALPSLRGSPFVPTAAPALLRKQHGLWTLWGPGEPTRCRVRGRCVAGSAQALLFSAPCLHAGTTPPRLLCAQTCFPRPVAIAALRQVWKRRRWLDRGATRLESARRSVMAAHGRLHHATQGTGDGSDWTHGGRGCLRRLIEVKGARQYNARRGRAESRTVQPFVFQTWAVLAPADPAARSACMLQVKQHLPFRGQGSMYNAFAFLYPPALPMVAPRIPPPPFWFPSACAVPHLIITPRYALLRLLPCKLRYYSNHIRTIY